MPDPTAQLCYPRTTLVQVQPGGTYGAGADQFGYLGHSNILPRFSMLTQAGFNYSISTAAGTAKAPVAVVPTTTASFALYNGNAVLGGGYYIHLLKVSCFAVSGTGAVGGSVLVGLSPTVQAAAVSGYAGVVGPKSLSSSPSVRTSLAVVGGAITLAGAPVWTQIGQIPAASGTVGSGATLDVEGLVIIPPGFACGFDVMSSAGTTPLYGWSFIYSEFPTYLA